MTNYTTNPEYEPRRRAMVAHAQTLALAHFSWEHVAAKVDHVLRETVARHTRHGNASGEQRGGQHALMGSPHVGRAHDVLT